MKQHITPKQAQEISEEQFYSLFSEIVHRKDWYDFHHKKVTIGKMIEILGENLYAMTQYEESSHWYVVIGKWNGWRIDGEQLVDCLWKAVKVATKAIK